VPALAVPNELTVAHAWKDEKKPREYDFDAVFGPGASQVRERRKARARVAAACVPRDCVGFSSAEQHGLCTCHRVVPRAGASV
jgi:hypothetical protein